MPLAKVKDKGQVTIPADVRERIGLDVGDYVEVKEEGNRIVLIPQAVVERHPEIDKAIAEGLADVRAGRVTPAFKTMEELEAWFETEEGKKFSNS
jgi:AbrB family looped-hinge helix DNA binding protein